MRIYIASGDFLTRNTERRVEVGVRVDDPVTRYRQKAARHPRPAAAGYRQRTAEKCSRTAFLFFRQEGVHIFF